jgi:DnaK suppressor protein
MDTPSQLRFDPMRDMLDRRLLELRGEVAAAQDARHQALLDHRPDVILHDEVSVGLQQVEIDDAQEGRDVDELEAVRAALLRLDLGSYGDCVDCGEPIPIERLKVQPTAARCAGCQVRREHR